MVVSEVITIVVGLVVISGVVTGGSVYFNRKVAQTIETNVNSLISQLTEFIKKNEQHLSQRISDLDLDMNNKIDKLETRQQRISDYTEENRERIHNVKETIFHVRDIINQNHPSRQEFEKVLEGIKPITR